MVGTSASSGCRGTDGGVCWGQLAGLGGGAALAQVGDAWAEWGRGCGEGPEVGGLWAD